MSTSKKKTDVCIIQARFEGGILDGQTRWVDKPHPNLVQCKMDVPLADEVLYAADCIYKLESSGTPLVYRVLK